MKSYEIILLWPSADAFLNSEELKILFKSEQALNEYREIYRLMCAPGFLCAGQFADGRIFSHHVTEKGLKILTVVLNTSHLNRYMVNQYTLVELDRDSMVLNAHPSITFDIDDETLQNISCTNLTISPDF